VPHAFYLILFGVATLWMSYELDWLAVRWPVALAADLVVFGVTMRALAPEQRDPAGLALVVQMTLVGAYLVSIAVRTLVRGRNVIPFEVVQMALALAVGFGGAVSVARVTGDGGISLGIASLVLGAASYAVAFAFIDRRQDRGRNVYFYTTLALVLVVAGCDLVLPSPLIDLAFAALALLACVLWARVGRLFLVMHGAAYLAAAALVSNVVAYAWYAFFFNPTGQWMMPRRMQWVMLVSSVVAAWFASRTPAGDGSTRAALPRVIVVLVTVGAVGGIVMGYLAPILAGRVPGVTDLGVLATARTCVLAISALVIAWIGTRPGFREWSWLVYPLLVVTGLKMVAHDFLLSRPATMFVALAMFGAALIFAPRLRRPQA
jgi:uncharacterized membrane protein YidH (DUF202 family)